MNIFIEIDKLMTLHNLIKNRKTGNPENLAEILHISRSSLYNLIDELKSYNAPICYSRTSKTFYYKKEFELEIRYSMRILEDESVLEKITGGCYFFTPSILLDGRKINL